MEEQRHADHGGCDRGAQAIEYLEQNTSLPRTEIENEVDRYIAWPGQALGYKMGQLKILELRERAKRELGERFDIRAFHDQILGGGALPLDVLDQRVQTWIATVKTGGGAPARAAAKP